MEKKLFFKIPLLAWIVLALWALVNILAMLSVGVNGQALGYLVGRILFPPLIACIVTYPIWLICRRSQRVASLTFFFIVILIIFGSLASQLPKH